MSIKITAVPVTISTLGVLAAAVLPASAPAAGSPPLVATGPAAQVSYAGAVLGGAVIPRGAETTYYVQYGPTAAYGLQTAVASAGAGHTRVLVGVPVGGLAPATRYHYRLVALNSAGAAVGRDRSFKTPPIPLSLQILGAPNPASFASPTVIEGTLSGTGNANRAVVLQENPFPYVAGFATIGNPELTSATGGFAFPVLGLTASAQFRVVALTKPFIISPIVVEGVAVSVTIEARRTHRRHHMRVFGAVTPNVEGMPVEILKLVGTRWVTVARTFTRGLSAGSAHFDSIIRVRRHRAGIYEALVRVTNGAQTSAYSAPIRAG